MSKLAFFRQKILQRQVVCRFLCTESSNNGDNPQDTKGDPTLLSEPTKKTGENNRKGKALFATLQESITGNTVQSDEATKNSESTAETNANNAPYSKKMTSLLQPLKDNNTEKTVQSDKPTKTSESTAKSVDSNAPYINKMSSLLESLKVSTVRPNTFDIEVAVPRKLPAVTRKYLKEDPMIIDAVNNVAAFFGGDQENTVNELHTRLKSHSISSEIAKNLSSMPVAKMPKEPNDKEGQHLQGMSREDMSPGGDYKDQRSQGGFQAYRPTDRSEGGFQAYRHTDRSEGGFQAYRPTDRSEGGFQAYRPTDRFARSRPPQGGDGQQPRPFGRDKVAINFETMVALDIFPPLQECDAPSSKSQLTTWDKCSEREFQAQTLKAPKNAFEEMVQWTDSGRMWTFPVDNERGMVEEKKYTFADHIFLDRHLEPWCPKTGPIRYFMHIVCSGMSQNPYISVPRKLAHIQWYQEYFADKTNRDILVNEGLSPEVLVAQDAPKLGLVNLKDFTITPLPKKPDAPRKMSKRTMKLRGSHVRSFKQRERDKKQITTYVRKRIRHRYVRTFKFI